MELATAIKELLLDGGYGIAAIFAVVIWKLYSENKALNKEMRTTAVASVKELTTAVTASNNVLQGLLEEMKELRRNQN